MINIKSVLMVLVLLTPALVAAAGIELTKEQLANVTLATAVVSTRDSHTQLKLNGVLTADQRKTHRVAPVVDGMVTELQVVVHERVRKGQVLARLRSHSLGQAQADYLEALARFHLAQAERTRIEGLWKDGVVAESRWLTVDSEYKSAQAALEARRRLLSLAGLSDEQIGQLADQPDRLAVFDLTSPIDGLVTGVEIESGELLSAGQTAFHVDDLSTLWALVKIPVASLPQVKVGAEAVISVRARPGQSYRGRLESLGGEVDAQSQTLTGRIVLGNPGERLRPGMYAEVGLSSVASRGLMVPAGAVFRVGDQAYVFKVLGSGRFEPVAVTIGAEADGWVPVRRGLAAGVEIVSEGVAELKSHWQYQGGE
ncbi:MAG: efflux RND transporter periplasmic adaptor subunit [Nitrospirota bacterium]